MTGDLLEAVDAAIGAMQARLQNPDTGKVSLPDLVRLLQLRRELEGDRPRQINARWIEEGDECGKSKD